MNEAGGNIPPAFFIQSFDTDCRGRVWHRLSGEAEDEFKARVAAEAPGPYPRLFVCTVGDAEQCCAPPSSGEPAEPAG